MLHIFAAVLALSDPTGPVVEARIADVIAEPERYGGRTVRIRGQVDACYADLCSICPEELTGAVDAYRRCLVMTFDDLEAGDYQDDGFDWKPRGSVGFRTRPNGAGPLEDAFRFSVVTVEGRFRAAATVDDQLAERVGVRLTGVRVQALHRRIPSNAGVATDRYTARLEPAPTEVTRNVAAAISAYGWPFEPRPGQMIVLVLSSYFQRAVDRDAWACTCQIDDCTGRWPERTISVYAPTINNPYSCDMARRDEDGVWRLYLG